MNFTTLWAGGIIPQLVFKSANALIGVTVASVIVCMVAGYLLGSINLSIIISSRFYKDDIRRHGSGNAGMTNVMRTYGKKMAVITFAGDFGKAVVASLIGRLFFGYYGALIAGFFCFLGHIFPCYYRFKGGKGVVTAAAMIIMTDPVIALILFVLFVSLVALTKYISAGSVVCMLVYPVLLYNIYSGFTGFPVLIGFAMGLLCAFAHRENLRRIFRGEENRFTFKVRDKKPVDEKSEHEDDTED